MCSSRALKWRFVWCAVYNDILFEIFFWLFTSIVWCWQNFDILDSVYFRVSKESSKGQFPCRSTLITQPNSTRPPHSHSVHPPTHTPPHKPHSSTQSPSKTEAQKGLATLAVTQFDIPGDSRYPLNSFMGKPANRQEAGRQTDSFLFVRVEALRFIYGAVYVWFESIYVRMVIMMSWVWRVLYTFCTLGST